MTGLALLALQVIAGWLLADFLSGVLHWIEDRFGRPDMPVLGPMFFAPNLLHHEQPLAFTRSGFLSRNGTTWAAVALIATPLLWIFGPAPWLVTAAIGGVMANQVHYWAHRAPRVPRPIALLQRTGILQSGREHQLHHAAPHHRRYCILTDWLNPALDTVRFWGLIESVLPRKWFAR